MYPETASEERKGSAKLPPIQRKEFVVVQIFVLLDKFYGAKCNCLCIFRTRLFIPILLLCLYVLFMWKMGATIINAELCVWLLFIGANMTDSAAPIID